MKNNLISKIIRGLFGVDLPELRRWDLQQELARSNYEQRNYRAPISGGGQDKLAKKSGATLQMLSKSFEPLFQSGRPLFEEPAKPRHVG
jgi:hypothetical protein